MTREEKLEALLNLFTCPHCEEIRDLGSLWNGRKVCRRCHDRACAGQHRLGDRVGTPEE